MIANSTAIIATATTLAEPRSSGLDRGDRFRRDGDARQQRRACRDGCDDEVTVAAQLDGCPVGRNVSCHLRCRSVVAPRGKPGGFAGGIHTAHLHRHRGEPRHAQGEHDDQSGDRERRFDGDTPGFIGYTLVLSARVMMLVNALTIESPVITVYRIAPNAAAAIVPIAYSTVLDYTMTG